MGAVLVEGIDEAVEITQSCELMRLTPIITVCCLAAFAVRGVAQETGGNKGASRSLTLQECIKTALEHNLDIKIERYRPELAKLTLDGSYGAYDPSFRTDVRQNFASSESGFNISTFNPPSNETWRETYSMGLGGEVPWSGLDYSLTSSLNRSSSKTSFGNPPVFNDSPFDYSSSVGINLSQPLLKNFRIDGARLQIALNKKDLKTSEQIFRRQLMNTVSDVQIAYYDLVAAIEAVKVQDKSLQLAKQLLAENKKRVEVGQMAKLDEEQAKSEVAAREADLISAQNQVSLQENQLKKLLSEDFTEWKDLALLPTETLSELPEAFSRLDSWQKGLSMRPDLLQSKVELEKQDIILKYSKNQLYPQLDLVGSYGYLGRDQHLVPSLGDIGDRRNPNFSYGVILTLPLGNRAAKNNNRSNKALKEQMLLQYKRLEQDIMVQIDDSIKQAQTSHRRIEATKQAREFAETALDAEKKKLASGKSTNFQVLQSQRDLTQRLSEELRALTDYSKALARLALSEGSTLDRNGVNVDIR